MASKELFKENQLKDTSIFSESGVIHNIADGIATIFGLNHVTSGEMISIDSSVRKESFMGMVLNLNQDSVGAVVFAGEKDVSAGDKVFRTKHKVSVPTGESVLGRVLDALGNPLDGKGPLKECCFKVC